MKPLSPCICITNCLRHIYLWHHKTHRKSQKLFRRRSKEGEIIRDVNRIRKEMLREITKKLLQKTIYLIMRYSFQITFPLLYILITIILWHRRKQQENIFEKKVVNIRAKGSDVITIEDDSDKDCKQNYTHVKSSTDKKLRRVVNRKKINTEVNSTYFFCIVFKINRKVLFCVLNYGIVCTGRRTRKWWDLTSK